MEWWKMAMSNYAGFQGRARRKEFWMFTLINILISIGLVIIGEIIGVSTAFSSLYSLVILLPSIAVAVRRLHDTGRSGWWYLIVLVPFAGSIILLVFMCLEGERGDNKYGPDPKSIGGSGYY